MKNITTQIAYFFLTLTLLLLFHSCKKEKKTATNPFPPNTEIGSNTFIFRVNGGEIINSQVGYLSVKPRIYIFYNHNDPYFKGNHRLELSGGKLFLGVNKFINFTITNLPSKGKYQLTDVDNSAFYEDENPSELYYYTDASHIGELDITKLDTTSHIISGTFLFKAKRWCLSGSCNEVITVDGQFDVQYNPNNSLNYY